MPIQIDSLDEFPRSLGSASGVYVISSRQNGKALYVGESHTNQLRKTLFRHFYRWPRDHFHKEPRAVYDRSRVVVAVWVLPASEAVEFQNKLICELSPRDNLLVCGPDNPF